MNEILTWSSCDRNKVDLSQPRTQLHIAPNHSLTPNVALIRATPPNFSCQRNSASAAFLRSKSPRWPAERQSGGFERSVMTHPVRKTWISGLVYQQATVASIYGRGIRIIGQREVCRVCTCWGEGVPQSLRSLELPMTLYISCTKSRSGTVMSRTVMRFQESMFGTSKVLSGLKTPFRGWVTGAQGLKDNRRPIAAFMTLSRQPRVPRPGIVI